VTRRQIWALLVLCLGTNLAVFAGGLALGVTVDEQPDSVRMRTVPAEVEG
jgi:hypothetical protein